MERYFAIVISVLAYIVSGLFVKIPEGWAFSLFTVFFCVLVLTYICAHFYSKNNLPKDRPLSNGYVQYSFVAIAAIYIGDSIRDSFNRGIDLNIPPLLAGIFLAVFCVATAVEAEIPPAKVGSKPEEGKEISNKRVIRVLTGTFITVVIPIVAGIIIKPIVE